MPLTLPYCTNLKNSVGDCDLTMKFDTGQTTLCSDLTSPVRHAFATIYTASYSERVIITGCKGSEIVVQRGVDGTKARSWPLGACVKITEYVAGAVCPDPENEVCGNIWDQIVVGKGLRINRTNPDAPVLELLTTGVEVEQMCGAEINECGQFTFIPPNWPAVCLPTFNPCCGDDGSGTGGPNIEDACDVPYAARFGEPIIQATNVCGALENLSDAIQGLSGGGSVLETISAGNGIQLTGTASDPIINLVPAGLSAGVYNGFSVNTFGQITGYAAVPAGGITISGAGPVNALFNPGTDNYTISVAGATISNPGIVRLIDEAEAMNATPAVLGNDVITWDFLSMWTGDDVFVAGSSPIASAYNSTTKTYTVSVAPATIPAVGVVKLADDGQIPNATPAIADTDAISWKFLKAWALSKGIV